MAASNIMSALAWYYQAELVRVIDGDTVVMRVDLGFSIYSEHAIRLAGINCPEHGTPEGDAATAFTRQWFVDHPNGLEIQTFKGSETEKYGRYLAYVYPKVGDGAVTLNAALLEAGHAVVMKG